MLKKNYDFKTNFEFKEEEKVHCIKQNKFFNNFFVKNNIQKLDTKR